MPSDWSNSRHPKGRPWLARVQIGGQRENLGYFPTKEEAERVELEYKLEHLQRELAGS